MQQWCYVMKNGQHVNLSDADLAVWAQAIANSEAAIRGPPKGLLFKWKEAIEADQSDDKPVDDGVSLVRKRKKPRKGNKQKGSGISTMYWMLAMVGTTSTAIQIVSSLMPVRFKYGFSILSESLLKPSPINTILCPCLM